MKACRSIALILLINTAGGCIPAVFLFLLGHHVPWSALVRQCEIGFVYAQCIGTPCFFLIDRLAHRIRGIRRLFQIPAFLIAFVVIAVVGSIPATLLFAALGWLPSQDIWPAYRQGAAIGIAITLAIGSVVTVFSAMLSRLDSATLQLRDRQLAEERAHKLATEARLSSLESRVHPHFLFNTLNSISALIRDDPQQAERTVERLAALLRYSLDTNSMRLVPLAQELRVVRDYLAIEHTRFGARLHHSVDAPEDLAACQLPPFALQTLVENSIKHAVSPSRRGGEIAIRVQLSGDSLRLEVSDDGPGFEGPAILPGHGLESLQSRLAALYDGSARLEFSRADGRTIVAVTVPQPKVPA